MKSCWIVTKDHQNYLEFRDVPVPQPKAGEIVIRVHASALNRGEIFVGGVVHGGPEKPGGNEASGVVHAVGEGVTGVKAGDAVFGRVRGGFAEYALMDAHQIMRKPEKLSWEQAAAVPVSFITAWEMIYLYGKLKAGETLLVMGASSGAGVACIQLAKLIGARSIGTSGSQQKLDTLKTVGLDVGIATRKPDFAEAVKQATGGKGVDLVINGVGGSVFADACARWHSAGAWRPWAMLTTCSRPRSTSTRCMRAGWKFSAFPTRGCRPAARPSPPPDSCATCCRR